jgi:hypothetical protein
LHLKIWKKEMNNAVGDIGRSTESKGTGSGDSYKVLLIDDPHILRN